jgi:rSAM/selenodomain-associated transferase 1
VSSSDVGPRAAGHGRRDVLVVFARCPEPGRVKSRLARDIGDAAAATIYAAFVADLRARFASPGFAVRWAIAPPDTGFAARFAIPDDETFAQQGDDLGARMRAAFARVSDAGFARCVLVGSDTPQLALATVESAFAALDDADLVLGPARDGGYYLIAAGRPLDVFAGIDWGTGSVLAATRARAAAVGSTVALLDDDFDVDDAADLACLDALLRDEAARAAMPATTAALRTLRLRRDA